MSRAGERDTKGHGSDPNSEMLVYDTDALRTGVLLADVRAALYRALAMVPGIEIADSAANLDGRIGVAFGIQHASERDETIIDPASGAFIGEREISTQAEGGIPAGTVVGYMAVITVVACRRAGLQRAQTCQLRWAGPRCRSGTVAPPLFPESIGPWQSTVQTEAAPTRPDTSSGC